MCGTELERLLLEPGGLERARELAQAQAAKGESIAGAPMGGIEGADPPPHILGPSREEVLAQDLSLVSYPRVHGLDAFIPELADKSPSEALRVLEARFRRDSSASNAALLQAGINRITTVGSSSQADLNAAQKAIELFHQRCELAGTGVLLLAGPADEPVVAVQHGDESSRAPDLGEHVTHLTCDR